jgi:glutamate/tyrosine decarboxylase-like PLP-dependent enzyme
MPSLDSLRSACATPLEHPTPDALRDAGQSVLNAVLDDFIHLPETPIGRTASRAEMERLLREPPPEAGRAFADVLAEFQAKVQHYAIRACHPRFLAFIPGAPNYASILADLLAANANIFAGVWKEAAGAAEVELLVLDWFKSWLAYPTEAAGLLTSGGSEANLTALVVARESVPHAERPRLVLYASDQRHWSIGRAAKIIGLAPQQVRPIPCDADFRLRVDALRAAIAEDQGAGRLPWCIVANAGTTNTGSIDPLSELADIRDQNRLWLHADAAYGWAAALTPRGRGWLNGIARADSITLDPHKWLAQPFEAGGLLVRRGELLRETFKMRPEYMQDVVPHHDEVNFCDHGIALTRRFRALKIWLSIKTLGVAWFRRLIEHTCALSDYAQALLEQAGCFEITSASKLSIVCFRHVPGDDDAQQTIADELLKTGRAFLSTTRLNDRTTLRFCFVNWRTTARDVEEIVDLLAAIGKRARS